MIHRLKFFVLSAVMAIVTVSSLSPMALAVDPVNSVQNGVNAAGGSSSQGDSTLKGKIKTVVDILLFLLGAIAVIMIVVGGLRYVLSSGDASQITSAKNTILYAVIGVIVALLAYAIVNWVIDKF